MFFYIPNGERIFCPQCADDVVSPVGENSVILKREGEQMFRRNLIALSILLGLAACGGEQPVEKAKPGEMRVMSVSVGVADRAKIDKRLQTLKLDFDSDRLVGDVRSAVTRELTEASRAGTRPVVFTVEILDIGLNSTIPGVIKPSFIYAFSQITARIRATDAQTGEVLVSRGFLGDDNPGDITFSGIVKDSFSGGKSKEKAYADVVQGFAEDLRRVLFEEPAEKAA